MPPLVSSLCEIAGFIAVVVGTCMVSVPAGLVVGGVLLIAAGVLAA